MQTFEGHVILVGWNLGTIFPMDGEFLEHITSVHCSWLDKIIPCLDICIKLHYWSDVNSKSWWHNWEGDLLCHLIYDWSWEKIFNHGHKTLIMIYTIKTFHRYLLGNSFTFIVDHQTLIYLVNNPTINGQIARRLLLL